MKKIITFSFFSIFLIISEYSEAQLSVKVDGEYMLPFAQTQLDPNINSTDYYNNVSPVTGPLTGSYGTLGMGPAIGIALDYTFKSNITLELSGRYWFGPTSFFSDSSFSYPNVRNLISFVTETQSIHFYTLSPMIFYQINTNSKFVPYIGVGLDIALGAQMEQTVYEGSYMNDPNPVLSTLYQTNYTTTFNVSIGATGQLGIKYNLSHHFNVFAGLQIDGLSLSPKEQLLISASINGINTDLSNYTTHDKEIDFVKNLSANANTNEDQPDEQLAEPVSASTFGVFAGFEIKF